LIKLQDKFLGNWLNKDI